MTHNFEVIILINYTYLRTQGKNGCPRLFCILISGGMSMCSLSVYMYYWGQLLQVRHCPQSSQSRPLYQMDISGTGSYMYGWILGESDFDSIYLSSMKIWGFQKCINHTWSKTMLSIGKAFEILSLKNKGLFTFLAWKLGGLVDRSFFFFFFFFKISGCY